MTLPFENDTKAITKKLAKASLKSEKRRNLMVVVAVALAAFLICFVSVVSVSLAQIQRNQVVDTYEAVWSGIDENDIENLKKQPEFSRVGGYYMLGQETSERGYTASYVYMDKEMTYIARDQVNLVKGRLPEKENEVAVSKYFLSTYGNNAKIGEAVMLDTESFHGEYTVTGITDNVGEKETNSCAIVLSKDALTGWKDFDPENYRAYVHFKNDTQLDEATMTAYCREITNKCQLPPVSMNHNYFTYYSKSIDLPVVCGVALIVLIGGYGVIQCIFRISINDKIQSYGQLRTIGATSKQIIQIVRREGRRLGSIGILIGIMFGIGAGFCLFSKGFNALYYGVSAILAVVVCWLMVSISIRKPIKIASRISPLEAVRFSTTQQAAVRKRKKPIKLTPFSMGIENFKCDYKKTISIIISLSLGGILLLVVSSALLARSPEQYARQYFPDGDYKIYSDSEQSTIELMTSGNPLNEALKQELLSVDGITNIIVDRQAVNAKIATPKIVETGMCDMITEQNYREIEQSLIEGTMPTNQHSILISQAVTETFEDMKVGKVVDFSFGDKTVHVTISGIFGTGMNNGHVNSMDGSNFFAPETLFHELLPQIKNFDYSWSIVGKSETMENELRNIVAAYSDLSLDTFSEQVDFYKTQNSIFIGSFQIFSWLIFLFGVINFINTTLSNQVSRKHENSILRSIGLTQKQLCKMNIYEGLCYAFFATVVTLIVGLPIAIVACREMSKAEFAREIVPYQFPILEMGLFILALFGMELILSVWTVHRQKKQSLIEQMRAME